MIALRSAWPGLSARQAQAAEYASACGQAALERQWVGDKKRSWTGLLKQLHGGT